MNVPAESGRVRSGDKSVTSIVVTGSSGVIGRRVVRELRRRRLNRPIVEFTGDITSEADVEMFMSRVDRIGACVHLAAVVPLARANADPVRTYEVNVLGTGRIIAAIRRHSEDAYFLHGSTSHVYSQSESALSESAPTGPVSTYGRSKLAAELIASDTASSYSTRLLVARIFSLWAADQEESFLYPSLMRRFAAARPGQPVGVPGGNNVRDFLHADEVARLLVELLLRETLGVVNVGSGRPQTILDFARIHAPEGVFVESEDSIVANSIVADTARLKEALRD